MKTNNIKNQISRWALALSVVVGLAACTTESIDDKEWVDPRYRNLEDSYTIAADGTETISFEIKSNMEWWVYNTNEDWCTIDPATGNDPESTVEVTLTYNANLDLEDRHDTFFLKSDYWVFKEVEVTQRGVATLTIDKKDDFISNDADFAKGTLVVTTNQDWRVEITSGDDWLSFDADTETSGEGDGSQIVDINVNYSAKQNDGEQRSATIEVYDRNDALAHTYTVTQDGLLLTTASELYFYDSPAAVVTLPVDTNLPWKVELVENVSWISSVKAINSLDYPDQDIADEVEITLLNNNGESRAVYLKLTSMMEVEGIEEIVKYVGVVQGSNSTPAVTYLNESNTFDNIGTSGWYQYNGSQPSIVAGAQGEGYCNFSSLGRIMTYPAGLPYGRYDLTVSDVAGTASSTFFMYLQFDTASANYVGFNVYGAAYKAVVCSSGSNVTGYPVSYTEGDIAAIDESLAGYNLLDRHTIGINVYEGEYGYVNYDWYIDDVLIQSHEGSTWINGTYGQMSNLVFGVNGSATGRVYSYSYTAPSEYDARPVMPQE